MSAAPPFDDDPYAPRSSSSYATADARAAAAEGEASGNAQSSSQPSLSTSSSRNASRPITRASEEPMFGGRTFRDSHRIPNPRRRAAPQGDSSEAQAGDSNRQAGVEDVQDEDAPLAEAEGGEQPDELYAVLNVERDASEDQIKEAYRQLAVMLHPDKHTVPARKAAAESRFRSVQRAYEILSDPEKRAVYDHFGEAGLNSSWALTTRTRGHGSSLDAADLRAELERASREKLEEDAEALVRSRGDIEARLDASTLFCHPGRVPRSKARIAQNGEAVTFQDRWNRVGVTQLSGKHGFETQLTPTTKGIIAGQMVSKNGLGGGNIIGTLRTQWSSKLWTETTATMLRPRIFSAKGQYEISQFSFLTFALGSPTLLVPPQVTLTYGQRLSKDTPLVGFTSVKSGTYALGPWGRELLGFAGSNAWIESREGPSISIGMANQAPEGRGWSTSLSVGAGDQNVSIDWGTRSAFLGGAKLRAGFTLGTGSGVSAFTSAERRVTENVRFAVGLNTSLPRGGVTLRLKLNRLGQKISIPILLSPEFRSDLCLLFTVIPAFGLIAGEHLYLRPAKRRRIADRLKKLRKENREMIDERRNAAVEARVVLQQGAKKRAESERQRGGVVVLQAFYGRKESFPALLEGVGEVGEDAEELCRRVWTSAGEEEGQAQAGADATPADDKAYWDVRIPLQSLVKAGQLVIPGGRSKAGLLGFYDPCMGERKHLVVRYLFRGRVHEVVVDDVTPLAAPLRSHQL